MCGIVGLFAKNASIEASLGEHLAAMLEEMTDRGPDSAGIAVYRDSVENNKAKLTLLAPSGDYSWGDLEAGLQREFGKDSQLNAYGNHAVIVSRTKPENINKWVLEQDSELRINSSGTTIEIFKEKGLPKDVIERFKVKEFTGTHALGHTRMATESAVTTEHSHPFSTGEDLCLVHNGSLSNHNRLRENLKKQGIQFATDNDSEVAAGYLTWRMQEGDDLDAALDRAIHDLDGFYTFAIGTRDGFAVLRDPIACKPAVIAESDDWVAMASEYRAIAVLPGANQADCWEPEPAQIYSWSH